MTEHRYINIFDTTLRDGEQAPGASLNHREKLEIAHALAALKVDVIEAGFPIASPDDFKAVHEIAETVRGPTIAALARTLAPSRAPDVDSPDDASPQHKRVAPGGPH